MQKGKSMKRIIKASAGTGKTYRLSLEYLYSLNCGIDFKEILVMTFTKKATAEIKERVVEFLGDVVNNPKKRAEYEKNLGDIYGEFNFDIPKIEKIHKDILKNLDKVKIYTIDAYLGIIFRRAIMPYLKIYSFTMQDSDKEKEEIYTQVFQKLFEDDENFKLFIEFLQDNKEKDMNNYIKIIKKIIENRWQFIILGDDLKKDREKLEYRDPVEYLDEIIRKLEEFCELKKGKNFDDYLKGDYKQIREKNKLKVIEDKFNIILDPKKSNIWNGNKVKGDKNKPYREELEKLNEPFKENLAKHIYNTKMIDYEKNLIKVVSTIYALYDEIKMTQKSFTFDDISNYVFEYLPKPELGFIKDGHLTEDFFDIMDSKINTIFIDEFQDTSVLQWKILKNIIDYAENYIFVGDEKQSIYGWRNGEKRLFENLDKILGTPLDILDTCYRSDKNIIEYVNNHFSNKENWSYENVRAKNDIESGCITHLIYEEDIIPKTILENFNGNYDGIGIVAGKNDDLTMITNELARYNIPYTLNGKSTLLESEPVACVYELLRFLALGDYLSLCNILRSDIINIDFSTLKNIIKKRKSVEKYIYDDGMEIEEIKELKIIKRLYDLYQNNDGKSYIIYDIIKELGVLNHFTTKGDTEDIYNFCKLLKNYEYISELIAHYEENPTDSVFKKISSSNVGVQIMTIHGSKGLEFDTLFYYHKTPSKRGRQYSGMEIYFEMDDKFTEIDHFLLTHTKYKNVLNYIKFKKKNYLEIKEAKKEAEKINKLYVALTRPKKNLFIVLENEQGMPDFNVENIGELQILPKKEEISNYEKKELDFNNYETEYRTPLDENYQNGQEKLYSHTLEVENRRLVGSVVHYFLENIKYWNEKEIENSLQKVFTKFSSILSRKQLENILSPEGIEKIGKSCQELFGDWEHIYNEYTICDGSNIYRLDRVMIKKGTIFIADYKTGEYDESQLKNYKNLLIKELKKSNIDVSKYDIITKYIEINI